ncbi:YihA family ribosome biogenesis GTP-binding protein [Rhodospirillum rubrum]|uniref:ribosome biogenesis GTP-binding protein YihA/YsxC n=1 Tax=Rhodospirillum rubrum TaxID=1085 RepID=UPI001906D4E3|nr:ribosome biogenesis GTP-binding protein YihA/YsxC [Rhodospirillum rubrum]MBK1664519.1 YihA family ribosome biogenesis GTP-binding protein [Rhodospirillum rubrum]MBK1676226.1 YihA family ribosome biogenesis GTP-binding protein [Rhodospirillum rubrum]
MADLPETPAFGAAFSDEEEAARALEAGRWLFSQTCSFVMGCVSLDTLPDHDLSEIAFAGRSNVGKSSLVNALTGRKTLARTSNTPGRTQELNYFRLGPEAQDPALMMVDLPGYGFAEAPKDAVKRWTRLIMAYLRGRPALRRVCLLIDSRHGIKENDRDVMRMLDEAAVSYQIILTKADKLKPAEIADVLARVVAETAKHVAAHPDVIVTSSQSGAGIDLLRAQLAALASP